LRMGVASQDNNVSNHDCLFTVANGR
jgi:hypothetical protein